jgi:hypothetical protein
LNSPRSEFDQNCRSLPGNARASARVPAAWFLPSAGVTLQKHNRGPTEKLKKIKAERSFTGNAPGAPSRWSTKRSSESVPVRPKAVSPTRFVSVFLRDALSLLSRLREPDRYGLLSALYLATFPTSSALRCATFVAPHLAFQVAAGAGRIFALRSMVERSEQKNSNVNYVVFDQPVTEEEWVAERVTEH